MRFAAAAMFAVAAALTFAGCAATPVPPATPGGTSGAPSPSSSTLSQGSGAAPPSAVAGAVARDDALLALLPETVGGAKVVPEPESFTEALGDPAFAANVGEAAFAVAVAGDDLASGVVAHLRQGIYSDVFFRDWRDTYDEGACGQAGGVAGNAETQLGGRTVFITSCAGGLRVYHAYLEARDVIVSLFSVGDRRFGEQLMAGLRP